MNCFDKVWLMIYGEKNNKATDPFYTHTPSTDLLMDYFLPGTE